MAEEERSRRQLQEVLVHSIGPDPTDTLMGYLPPVGWADVATKHDVDGLGTILRAEMSLLRSELQDETQGLGGVLRGEMQQLRMDLRGEMQELRVELNQSLRVQLYWMVGLVVTLIAAQLAATTALIATR